MFLSSVVERYQNWSLTCRKDVVERVVGLKRPDALVVPVEGGDTTLLSQRPELDGAV